MINHTINRMILSGAFWLKSELFLTKIRIPNFKIQLLGRAKKKGVGGKEFLPALAFRFQFFSAAEFRASETGAPPWFQVFIELIITQFTKFFN